MEVTKEFLQNKLSPLEDKKFTRELKNMLLSKDLLCHKRKFRGDYYIMITPSELWILLFDDMPNKHDTVVIGRSLQALYWERSSLQGTLIFVKKVREYEDFGY